jgi:hypothetical protein
MWSFNISFVKMESMPRALEEEMAVRTEIIECLHEDDVLTSATSFRH